MPETYLSVVVECIVGIHCCCNDRRVRWAGINRQAKPSHQLNREVSGSHRFRGYNDVSPPKHSIPLTGNHLEKQVKN